MTTAQIAIPAVFLAFSALFVLSRVVRHRNAARAHGRHENGHTVHDGLPPAARRLPSAQQRAAAFASLAEPCWRCGGDHIGDCPPWDLAEEPASLPAHLRPGVVLPATPKLAPALEPLPDEHDITEEQHQAARAHLIERHGAIPPSLQSVEDHGGRYAGPLRELLPAELTGEEAAALRERHAESLKRQGPIHLPPDPDLTITAGPGADEAYQDVVNAGMHDARRRPGGQTTGEIFEHLCEGTGCWCHSFRRLPAAVVRELKHETVDEAVASIVLHAKEAAEFRAELEARLAEDDAAHADGQVASDA
jgi:hypothetical protein